MDATQPRHSTRLAQCVNLSENPNSPDGGMFPAEPSKARLAKDSPTQPSKRKAATSKSQPKPKRVKMLGKLSGLLTLPLDIFFEITSHLDPLDLLHLSRVSRHFARMFLRTDNRHAWLAARRTMVGLPECPSDLSEAQYAHLLFESICSGCGKVGRRLLFNLRVRFCTSCYKDNVKTYRLGGEPEEDMERVLRFLPRNYNIEEPSVIEYLEDQLHAVEDEYSRAIAMEIEAGRIFLAEKQAAVFAHVEHGHRVEDFLDDLRNQQEQEKRRLREARKVQIDARIMGLGYTCNEIPIYSLKYQEEVKKPKALTERAWRGMADKMDELAASHREEVLRQNEDSRSSEWRSIYDLKCSCFHGDWPDPLNAAQTVTVRALLAEANSTIPFTLARFDAHAARIRADVAAWRDAAQRGITAQLAAVYGLAADPASSDALCRASAVMRCGECAGVLFAADVMCHLHLCKREGLLWEERSWEYYVSLHRIARGLLHHAGLALDVRDEQVRNLEWVLWCGCRKMGVPRGFLELVTHLWQENWACDATFKLCKLPGGHSHCDDEPQIALDDACPSKADAVVLLEMPETLYCRSIPAPLNDDDPCCRLCGEACYMQVDMRSPAQAKSHMQRQHGMAEVLEEYLCPLKDVLRAAQEYVNAHGGQIITTRMGGR